MLLLLVKDDSLRFTELGFAVSSSNEVYLFIYGLFLVHITCLHGLVGGSASWLISLFNARVTACYCLWYICERALVAWQMSH